MKKETKENTLERVLDYRWGITLNTHKRAGLNNNDYIEEGNPDYIYYRGILRAVEILGYYWKRNESGQHSIYKN